MSRMTCMCGMPKNPFATTTPSEQWTQKQANPFLRNGNGNSNSNNNISNGNRIGNGNSNSNGNSNMFLGPGSGSGSGPIDAPITFDEQSFPSLTPSSDCKKQPGLNFKLAVSTGLVASIASTVSTVSKQGITPLKQGITSLNSNNMFLCPQWNANTNANTNTYDYAVADADAYADTDAYDSAYTKYYNDGR